ncbi:histidine phosphatase family protein [Jatrophihabitans sp.]|uniref:histidine phosphatase family protein n=1 Tax=Jatrophihabitans sp. TaxID=1932789 RepID=UPI0030C73C4F|nr:phosphoglycerate mutase [Jatrophihabitans sp.]
MFDVTRADPGTGSAFVMPADVPDRAQLWLIRHGQTEWSRTGRHTGATDIPLTPFGEREAAALAPLVAGLSPALVLCSPRARALRTAELAGLAVDEISPDLVEWDYGDYEGLTSRQIHETDPGWTIFGRPTPGGETAAEVAARADRVLSRAAVALRRGPVILVAHGHISRVLGARWIGLPVSGGANLLLDEAAPCILSAQYGEPAIAGWNRPNPAIVEGETQ